MNHITTPNMLEISYLLDRHHRIVAVDLQRTWPYGIPELAVTLEGENIDLDHYNFLRHGDMQVMERLGKTFEAILSVVDQNREQQAVGGGL